MLNIFKRFCIDHSPCFSPFFLGDMVSDWLKMQDDVMTETGEPTWNSLIEALEKIGQKTIAKIIKGVAPY